MKQTIRASSDSTIGILPQFVRWYFFEKPTTIICSYGLYAHAFSEAFSFWYMIKTFFAPWKSIKDEYPSKGLNLEMIMQTLTLNVTARVIGMIFRSVAILTGIIIQIVLLLLFTVYLAAWVLYPVIVLMGIVFLLRYRG